MFSLFSLFFKTKNGFKKHTLNFLAFCFQPNRHNLSSPFFQAIPFTHNSFRFVPLFPLTQSHSSFVFSFFHEKNQAVYAFCQYFCLVEEKIKPTPTLDASRISWKMNHSTSLTCTQKKTKITIEKRQKKKKKITKGRRVSPCHPYGLEL